MSDYDIHSCGYYCDRHACIVAQRNELRDKFIDTISTPIAKPEPFEYWNSDKPNNEFNPDWDAMSVMVEEQQRMGKRIEELETALAQPKQEPVGNTLTFMTRAIFNIVADHQEINGGYFIADGDVAAFVDRLAKVINSTFEPLKHKGSAPPQREWQGLTKNEYEAMAEQYVTNCYFDTLKYAKAIEAKLKEKNSTTVMNIQISDKND